MRKITELYNELRQVHKRLEVDLKGTGASRYNSSLPPRAPDTRFAEKILHSMSPGHCTYSRIDESRAIGISSLPKQSHSASEGPPFSLSTRSKSARRKSFDSKEGALFDLRQTHQNKTRDSYSQDDAHQIGVHSSRHAGAELPETTRDKVYTNKEKSLARKRRWSPGAGLFILTKSIFALVTGLHQNSPDSNSLNDIVVSMCQQSLILYY